MTTGSILAINAGSSSVKFQVFSKSSELQLLAIGKVSDLGGKPLFTAMDKTTTKNQQSEDKISLPTDCTHHDALQSILDWNHQKAEIWQVNAVVHRVVHGGTLFKHSVQVTPEMIKQLKTLIPLAPLHQPHNLTAIEMIDNMKPNLPQVACFDTAFHANQHALFTTYALPQSLRDAGIRRYGFHGLSYEWIAHSLREQDPSLAKGRVIAAHLGNGASLCAMQNGISVDTTLGMTALAGLPMGTRCGELDPGAVIFMLRELGFSPQDAEYTLYNQSGLLGLSGLTNDVERLEKSNDERAEFALDYFCLKAAQHLGMMAIAIGGVDCIVFTGGIGEHSELVRNNILRHVECLKPFETRVIPANEEWIMAMHALAIL